MQTRTSSTRRRIILERKSSPKYSNPRCTRNGRNQESSTTTNRRGLSAKLTENHEAIQQLISQLQQIQEQMDSMNDSGVFQDVESNYSGRLSHVSSQFVMIPSFTLCSSATKDCRLIHGINPEYRKTFLEIIFTRLIHPEIILKEFNLTTCKETPEAGRMKTSHTSADTKIEAQLQCQHLQQGR